MIRKRIMLFLLLIATLFMTACSDTSPDKKVLVNYNTEKGIISIQLDGVNTSEYTLKANGIPITFDYFQEAIEINILERIKNNAEITKDIALIGAKNNNLLEISLNCGDLFDTLFYYQLTPDTIIKEHQVHFSGLGAKVNTKVASLNVNNEMKRWLFRKQELLDEETFRNLCKNYEHLIATDKNAFVATGQVPVVKTISGQKYNITSNLTSDFYAIVACDDQKFINQFIENSVVNDYKNLSTSKTSLSCVQQNKKSGYFCIFLLGINKDYSFEQIPLAIVAVDNEAPTNSSNMHSKAPQYLSFKNQCKVFLPKNTPSIFGAGIVRVVDWDGNGLECNVRFSVEFIGDCKSITIQRRGMLCYPSPYGYHFKPQDKTFYAKDHPTMHLFSWQMHFEQGFNDIPIIVEDYHGNKTKYNVTVEAKFTRPKTPSINISNSNTIYN